MERKKVVKWMKNDINNGNPIKGLMKRTINKFGNCFGSSPNSNIAKCMSWWKNIDAILIDMDMECISHRITKKKRLHDTN